MGARLRDKVPVDKYLIPHHTDSAESDLEYESFSA